MRTHRLANAKCPYCDSKIDGASDPLGDAEPKPGDITICIYCAGLMVFDQLLIPRFPTDEEVIEARKHPEVAVVRAAVMKRIGTWDGDEA